MTLNEQRQATVKECLVKLGEFYEHVQILATNDNDDGTTGRCFSGRGNFFARQGMAHEFINEDFANEQAVKIAAAINPEDEESE